MDVTDALRALGGTARWKSLRGHVGWRAIKRARAVGAVDFRDGAYHVVGTGKDRVMAVRLRGVRSHTTAAAFWRFALPPASSETVHLTVPTNAHRDDVPDDVMLRTGVSTSRTASATSRRRRAPSWTACGTSRCGWHSRSATPHWPAVW